MEIEWNCVLPLHQRFSIFVLRVVSYRFPPHHTPIQSLIPFIFSFLYSFNSILLINLYLSFLSYCLNILSQQQLQLFFLGWAPKKSGVLVGVWSGMELN